MRFQQRKPAFTRKSLWLCICLVLGATAVVAQEAPRVIHVFVALCDNKHQGIVPVPKKIGNGDNCDDNLYWGAMYGVRTQFKRSSEWKLLTTEQNPEAGILERCVFQHKSGTVYLVADAYQGSKIRQAVEGFLDASAGKNEKSIKLDDKTILIAGGSDLLAYVGHNGLMDFSLPLPEEQTQKDPKEVVILACKSKAYFEPYLSRVGATPVVLTTNFMAPEAYVLEAALTGWVAKESPEEIGLRAAKAYNTYQKCGIKGARRLFGVNE